MLEAQLVKRNNPEDHAALRSFLLGAGSLDKATDLRGRLSFLLLSVAKIPGRNDSSEQGLVLAHGYRGLLVHPGGEAVAHPSSENLCWSLFPEWETEIGWAKGLNLGSYCAPAVTVSKALPNMEASIQSVSQEGHSRFKSQCCPFLFCSIMFTTYYFS